MLSYESVFIALPDLSPKRLEDLIEKIKNIITKSNGQIKAVEKWGRRRLSYTIGRSREGFYVLVTFQAPGTVLAELTQFYKLSDDVLRFMTCRAPRPGPVVTRVAPAAVGEAVPSATPPAATPAVSPSAPAAS